MPKSRGRKPRRPSKQRAGRARTTHSGWGDFEPWARAMMMADEAEARGDALGALEVMEAFRFGPDGNDFWRPWRVHSLLQIAELAPILPGWVTSRWICNQALQCLHDESRRRIGQALDVAVQLHGDRGHVAGVDEAEAQIRVVDRDWVYRQVFLYELGGLEFFVRRVASSSLLAGADSIHEWARTPMGGYELVDFGPAVVTWLDLGSRARHEIANIGSAVFVGPGEHVIGRLVPTEDGVMFESQPLRVPEPVARAVAERPADWLEALRAATTAPGEEPILTQARHRDSLLSDVPEVVWQLALVGDRPLPGDPADDALDSVLARAVLDAAAHELEREAEPRPDGEVDIWACLGAALLEPYVVAALPEVCQPADRRLLLQLGELLARPASLLCLAVADRLAEAA